MTARPTASSYRLRLIVSFTIVIVLLAGAWAWSLYGPLDAAVRSQQEKRLTDLALTDAATLPISTLDSSATLERLDTDKEIRLTLVADDGTVLFDSEADARTLENHRDRPEIREALSGRIGTDVRRSATQGIERMYVAVPVLLPGGELQALRTSESLETIATLASRARKVGLLALLGTLLVASVAAWRLAQSTARPVGRLAEAALAMSGGDLSVHIPVEQGPLGPLSEALTALREQLRERLADLEHEREALRLTLDGLSDAVLLLEGDRVALANRALTAMFRLPPGGAEDRSVAELGLPAPIEAAVLDNLGLEAAKTLDLGPDPFQRYQRLTLFRLGEEKSRTLVTIADVTERMRLDAVRRDFVANASHELKTPVSSILLLSESADHAARDGNAQDALAFLGQISGEAQRLRKLVTELLDLSRLESVPRADEIADVRRAVQLALAGHRPSAQAKGLSLTSDLVAVTGEDVAVRCGSTDLAVVLDNLLANAVAYTEQGTVTVVVSAGPSSVTIAVSDTGIGIPEADLERVFERFYRVDRARSRSSGGTGLGLSLVRNIVEGCGGTVRIESAVGAGTTVSAVLPRAR